MSSAHEPLLSNAQSSSMSSDTSSSAMLRSASRGSRPSFRAQRRDSAQLNNNMLGDTEPMLPAAPVPSQLATDTHDPRWGEHTGKPNRVAQWRYVWREELAEVIGSAMIILFGAGVECQTNLHMSVGSGPDAAKSIMQRLAWAVGVAAGVWTSGGASGGHLNPSVTIALCVFRGFPARRVPWFIASQILGCTIAALIIYANYYYSISLFEGGHHIRTVTGPHATAPLFFTFPLGHLPWTSAFFSEFLATGVLLCLVFALSDKQNLPPPVGVSPIAMFLVLVGIGSSFGINTGYGLNFARDSGPRLALWLVGYGNEVWTSNHFYAFWGPGLAATLGGLAGGLIYDTMVYTGADSPVNRPIGGRSNPRIDDDSAILEDA